MIAYTVISDQEPRRLTALAEAATSGFNIADVEQDLARRGILEPIELSIDLSTVKLNPAPDNAQGATGADIDPWLLKEIFTKIRLELDDPVALDGGFWTWATYRYPQLAIRRWGSDIFSKAERPSESRNHVRANRQMSCSALGRHTFACSWWAGATLRAGCSDDNEFESLWPIVGRASFRRNVFEREVGLYPELVAAAAIVVRDKGIPVDGGLDSCLVWLGERNGTSQMEAMSRDDLVSALTERLPQAAKS